jgi:glycine/D-amino acid oxidase-like deaminating enzyme
MARAVELETQSYWEDSASVSRYPRLDRNLTVDVVDRRRGHHRPDRRLPAEARGRRVAVIDRRRCGGVDSGLTTAHVTCVTDVDLSDLVKRFGRDHARAAWDAGLAAIEQIDRIVRDEEIDCEWTWIDGYKHAAPGADEPTVKPCAKMRDSPTARLRRTLRRCGPVLRHARHRVRRPGQVPSAQVSRGARQADRRRWLARLRAYRMRKRRKRRLEGSSLRRRLTFAACGFVVIATHTPLMGKTNLASALGLQTKLYLYTSYVLGGRLPQGDGA